MLFFLLFQPLLQHLLKLLEIVNLQVLHGLFQHLGRDFIFVFQPVPYLLRNILHVFHPVEKFGESQIKFVVFRLAFDENSAAQIIERRQA